jgi:hypothetical protein
MLILAHASFAPAQVMSFGINYLLERAWWRPGHKPQHSSENTSQVVENAYSLLEFSSPGMSAALILF